MYTAIFHNIYTKYYKFHTIERASEREQSLTSARNIRRSFMYLLSQEKPIMDQLIN